MDRLCLAVTTSDPANCRPGASPVRRQRCTLCGREQTCRAKPFQIGLQTPPDSRKAPADQRLSCPIRQVEELQSMRIISASRVTGYRPPGPRPAVDVPALPPATSGKSRASAGRPPGSNFNPIP